MEKTKMIKELIYMIDIAMDVMRDNWDAEYDIDNVIGNAQVVLDAARTLKYYKDSNIGTIAEDKRIFRLEYNPLAFSEASPKYFTFDELTDEQGFTDEDRSNADILRLNESRVISDGYIKIIRVR